MEVCIKTA